MGGGGGGDPTLSGTFVCMCPQTYHPTGVQGISVPMVSQSCNALIVALLPYVCNDHVDVFSCAC